MFNVTPPPTHFLKGKKGYLIKGEGFLNIKTHLIRMIIAGRDVFIARNISQTDKEMISVF